jgi:hypothetical protein
MSPARSVPLSVLLAMFLLPARPAPAGPALTVYSHDLGLVRERRTLDLQGARDTLRLPDISEQLDFSSVRLVPVGSARVTRLAYRFDVATGDGLIDRARGSRVRIASRGDRVTEGTLIAADANWLVVQTSDGGVSTVARSAVEEIRLSKPPGDMSLRPTLEAVVEGGKKGRVDAELSYLTGGLSWNAEHTLVRTGEATASWSAAVTVDNATGIEFRDASLKLVAGDLRRVGQTPPMPRPMDGRMSVAAMEKTDLSEESFADYHLYTLDRPATLRDRESQTLTMLEPRAVKVTPRYLYRGGANGVATQLLIENTPAAGLGVALPAGRVRVYESDPAGALQLTGEARIGHTAEGEKITLEVGTAFDLAAERREVYNKRITDHEREYQIEIRLRDRKKSDVAIVVEESVGGDNEVLKSSHPYVRKDANTIQFTLPVPAGKETVLTYTVHMRY